jgi:hypothetical protein
MAFYEYNHYDTFENDRFYNEEEEEYEGEEYSEDEYYSDEEPVTTWPKVQRKTPLPPVDFLIDYAPKRLLRPAPIAPELVKKKHDYDEQVKKAREEKERLDAAYARVAAELEKEKVSAAQANKWSNRGQREATMKRLNSELDLIAPNVAAAKKKLDEVEKSGDHFLTLWKASENLQTVYQEYITWQFESWNKLYGQHTPFNTTKELMKYYEVVGEPEELESGYTRFRLADDMLVRRAIRELMMGGHDFAQVENWDCILLNTEALKRFDSV